MAKMLKKCDLEELYERASESSRVTPKMREYIIAREVTTEGEGFQRINKRWCKEICTIPGKEPESVDLRIDHRTEILFVSKHAPPPDKWKNSIRVNHTHTNILKFIMTDKLRTQRWAHTFMAKCGGTAANAKPLTAAACKSCMPYLDQQIRDVKPKVIVSLHTEVTKALGLKGMSNANNRGWVGYYDMDGVQIPVLVSIHPAVTMMIRQNASGAMWGPDYFGVLYRDCMKAVQIARGDVTLKTLDEAMRLIRINKQVIVTRTLEEVKFYCDKINNMRNTVVISWDTETTGLDPWHPNARLLCSQFGYRREDGLVQAIVIPLWHKDNDWYSPTAAWKMIAEILLSDRVKVAHNAKFDILYTAVTTKVRALNVKLDTMLLLHSLNSGISGNYSLKTAVWDYLLESGLGGYEDRLALDHVEVKDEQED